MATTFSIRPLQGGARWVAWPPGALPPATPRIPFGDYHRAEYARRPAKARSEAAQSWLPFRWRSRFDFAQRP
jgi:hypothetical protein